MDGLKQVVAYATPAAEGMKALTYGLGLPEPEVVYVASFVNAHNEWEMFNGLPTSGKEYYIRECLKERKGWRFKPEVSVHQSYPGAHVGIDGAQNSPLSLPLTSRAGKEPMG